MKALILCALVSLSAQAATSEVFFVGLKSGTEVSSPLTVKMGIKGMKIRPAGQDVNDTQSGHFHILVDKPLTEKGQVIPTDSGYFHYGKAQEEATLTLSPGKHSLTLLLGDGAHRSYGKELSQTVQVTVK